MDKETLTQLKATQSYNKAREALTHDEPDLVSALDYALESVALAQIAEMGILERKARYLSDYILKAIVHYEADNVPYLLTIEKKPSTEDLDQLLRENCEMCSEVLAKPDIVPANYEAKKLLRETIMGYYHLE